ncbi:hypothetical protein [Acinetobacter lwoffii]|uniref:hypothetical protein n=1 Tax=Acinetobacter lwoffii TaxID=28090 RepID=UPI003F904CA3
MLQKQGFFSTLFLYRTQVKLIHFYENLNEFTFTRYLDDSSYINWEDEDFDWEEE